MNFNETKLKEPDVEMINQKAPEPDGMSLELLEYKVHTIKSESVVPTTVELESLGWNSLEPEVSSHHSLELKSEMLDGNSDAESAPNISIKQELVHEELDIKSEDETIQELHHDDKNNSGNQFQNHIQLPSKLKSFTCDICGYESAYKRSLIEHIRTHTGEKPFKCHLCDHSSSQRSSLKTHLRIHSGEKPFKCYVCGYRFIYRNVLKNHLRIHTGEKPFKCNICDLGFRNKSVLQYHLKIHTGEKPFKCNICDYRCVRNSDLKRHLLHHNERRFKCSICFCSFTQESHWNLHIKNHMGVK